MKKMKNGKRYMLHAAAGLVLMLLCCVGGAAEVKAISAGLWHDQTCECRSRESQTVLRGSVHKFYVQIRDNDGNKVDASEIKTNWNYASDRADVEIVKTDGTTAWIRLQEEAVSVDNWGREAASFEVFAVYSGLQEDGDKDIADGGVYLSAHYFLADDFYIIPIQKNVVINAGETKKLSLIARHYTSGHPEGEDMDISQYARWRAQNEGFLTISADGTVTAKKSGSGSVRMDAEKMQEALPKEWYFPNLVNNINAGSHPTVFVTRNGEILTDLSKIILSGESNEDEYVYFKPSYAAQYRLYGSDPERLNDEYMVNLFELDSDQGYDAWIREEPVPGKVYLLNIPNRASSEDKTVTIRPVHEHVRDQGVLVREPTSTMQGLRRYYCIQCGILLCGEDIPKLNPKDDPVNPPLSDETGNDIRILETPDAVYDVLLSKNGQTTLSYRASRQAVSSVTIPDIVRFGGKTYRVTGISAKAFRGSKDLKKVTIGKGVTFIGKQAFDGCSKLKTVSGGQNVVSIGESAFFGCKALKKVTIGANVNRIGKKAFGNCKKLAAITVKTTKLTKKNVGKNAFLGTSSKVTVKVPEKKVKAYRTLLGAKGISKKAKIK